MGRAQANKRIGFEYYQVGIISLTAPKVTINIINIQEQPYLDELHRICKISKIDHTRSVKGALLAKRNPQMLWA